MIALADCFVVDTFGAQSQAAPQAVRSRSHVRGGQVRGRFTYEAADQSSRRRQPLGSTVDDEDRILPQSGRDTVVALTRNLRRNFAIAAWAIRCHVNYVSAFTFGSRSGEPEVDKRIEELMEWWALPANCDSRGRHSLAKMFWLAEHGRTTDGDLLVAMLQNGRLWAIEGDRVRNPYGQNSQGNSQGAWIVNGVELDPEGRHLAYWLRSRWEIGRAQSFTRLPADYVIHYGFFDRFDEVRGVSPMAAAVNTFQDVKECALYALAKAKVSQLIGLKITRPGDGTLSTPEDQADDSEETTTDGEATAGAYPNLAKADPFILDLLPDEDAGLIEASTPSTQFKEYCDNQIMLALKALDIPMCFYDEAHTNFSGARQGRILYEQSAATKRADQLQMRDRVTAWKLAQWVAWGVLQLPGKMTLADLDWEWIPNGIPWLDPQSDTLAAIAGIYAGIETRTDVLRRQGRQFKNVADTLAYETKYLIEQQVPMKDVPLLVAPPQPQPEPANGAQGNGN
jgi:capsid protein